MKSNLVGCFLGVCLLAYPVNFFGQDTVPGKTAVSKPKHNSKVETKYDKEKNETTVYLRPMTVRYTKSSLEAQMVSEGRTDYLPAEILTMTAYFISPDKVLLKPQFVVFALRSMALDKTKYASDRSLTMTLDGLLISFGSMTIMERRVETNMNLGSKQYMVESLELPIPYETFLKVTAARKVKLNVAGEAFELKKEHLEAFRDLVRQIAQ